MLKPVLVFACIIIVAPPPNSSHLPKPVQEVYIGGTLCLLGEDDDGAGSICLFDANAGWILGSTTAWFSSFSCKL